MLAGPFVLAGLLTGLTPAATHASTPAATARASTPACQAWTLVPPGNPGTQDNELAAVTVLSASDAWAVGTQHNAGPLRTLIEHWNGSAWSVLPSPSPGSGNVFLSGVRAASPSSVWAVGSYTSGTGTSAVPRTLILHWDGTAWVRQPSPNPGAAFDGLNAVRVVSASDAWAVGSYAGQSGGSRSLILHWDGTAWKRVPSPSPGAGNNLTSVAATSASSAWAVGEVSSAGSLTRRVPGLRMAASADPRTFIVHWNGTKWSTVPSPSPGAFDFLTGVGATSASNAWAVGTTSTGTDRTLTLHWDGTAWKRVPSPNAGTAADNGLNGVNVTSPGNAWAVGDFRDATGSQRALVLRWDGTTWQRVTIPSAGTSSVLLAVGASSAANAMAVGTFVQDSGQALALHCG